MDHNEINEYFRRDRFAAHVGIQLKEASAGYARAELEIEDQHLNAVDLVHGAAIFSLADLVFAVASNSHGKIALGINVSITYMAAARGKRLVAEAKEVSINPKLATYLIHVRDDQDQLIALFQGTVYRKRESLESLAVRP